jgi:hypothetical protein
MVERFSTEEMTRLLVDTRKDVREIKEHVLDLKESKATNSAKIEGHSTQITMLWTILVLSIGSLVAAFFKL